jgi:hypothetical protein
LDVADPLLGAGLGADVLEAGEAFALSVADLFDEILLHYAGEAVEGLEALLGGQAVESEGGGGECKEVAAGHGLIVSLLAVSRQR